MQQLFEKNLFCQKDPGYIPPVEKDQMGMVPFVYQKFTVHVFRKGTFEIIDTQRERMKIGRNNIWMSLSGTAAVCC